MRLAYLILFVPALAAAEPEKLKLDNATLSVDQPKKLDDLTLTLERGGKIVWQLKAGRRSRRKAGAVDPVGILRGLRRGPRRAAARQARERALDVACRRGETCSPRTAWRS